MYSQRGEDDFLMTIFGDEPGRFLDIGSFDGKENSNVWWTLEFGWSGVMVEPAAVPFAGLLRNVATLTPEQQARLTLVNCAVACETGLVAFQHSPDQLSTLNEDHYQKWAKKGQYQPCYVHTMTIEGLLTQFAGPYNLVSIDAEGLSVELFLRLPLAAMAPKAIVVEHNGERLVELGKFAHDHGYKQSWIAGENVIYTLGRI